MAINVLYYPSIAVPNNDWLRHVLLYVDKIGSIVPHDYEHRCEDSPHIRMLMQENQYQPLSPEGFLCNSSNRKNFEAEVLKRLGSRPIRAQRQSTIRKNEEKSSLIHGSKFSCEIHQFMTSHGLIHATSDGWHGIDEMTANLYMALLAKHMAFAHNYSPSTDELCNERQIFRVSPYKMGYQVAFLELLHCLPVPIESTPIDDILHLKRRRGKELRKFQRKLLEFQWKLANANTIDEVNHIKNVFTNELEIGLEEIHEYFGESRIESFLISLRSLFELKNSTLLAGGIAGLAAYSAAHPTAATLAVTGVSIGTLHLGSRLQLRRKLRDNPFSYVFHLNKRIALATQPRLTAASSRRAMRLE